MVIKPVRSASASNQPLGDAVNGKSDNFTVALDSENELDAGGDGGGTTGIRLGPEGHGWFEWFR